MSLKMKPADLFLKFIILSTHITFHNMKDFCVYNFLFNENLLKILRGIEDQAYSLLF